MTTSYCCDQLKGSLSKNTVIIKKKLCLCLIKKKKNKTMMKHSMLLKAETDYQI